VQPHRIVRSEAELEDVATDSLVSGAYWLQTILEKQAPNEWVAPGTEEVWTTAAVWEFLTGAYETVVLDEDREVWVLIDAAAPQPVRPPRGADSHDFLTRAGLGDRNTEWVTHATLDDARAEIESLVAVRPSAGSMVIYAREDKERIDYHPVETIEAGTSLEGLPWKAGPAASGG
jgi:hypothetical protein